MEFNKITKKYSKASNAKVNFSKTLWITLGNPEFKINNTAKKLKLNENFQHLGILFNFKGIDLNENINKVKEKILNTLNSWRNRKISIKEKITLVTF